MRGLGIVSWIELAMFLMFIALIAWNLAIYLHESFAIVTPKFAAIKGEKM